MDRSKAVSYVQSQQSRAPGISSEPLEQTESASYEHVQQCKDLGLQPGSLDAGMKEPEACLQQLGDLELQSGSHELREELQGLPDIGHLQDEILFQELVAQLLLSSHLQGDGRLGSGELVQLRRLFQETRGRFKVDSQVEVKGLEAEMRDLKVQGADGEAQCKGRKGRLRYVEGNEYLQMERRAALSPDLSATVDEDLQTKLRLVEMNTEEDRPEIDSQQSGGKRRTCFGGTISKPDIKRSRSNFSTFTNLILENLETR